MTTSENAPREINEDLSQTVTELFVTWWYFEYYSLKCVNNMKTFCSQLCLAFMTAGWICNAVDNVIIKP